jgi:hypothetical protein
MKNRLLSITRGIIPYVKELRPYAGSISACILMQQLEYWFDKIDSDSFYKFLSPCKNEFYKDGDSWCEEIGISEKEFRNAFDNIGLRHASKNQFETSTDKFQGKFYASYNDKIKGLTFYFRNDELVDNALNEIVFLTKKDEKSNLRSLPKVIYGTDQRSSTELTKGNLQLYTENTTKNTAEEEKNNKKNFLDSESIEKSKDLNDADKSMMQNIIAFISEHCPALFADLGAPAKKIKSGNVKIFIDCINELFAENGESHDFAKILLQKLEVYHIAHPQKIKDFTLTLKNWVLNDKKWKIDKNQSTHKT